MVSFVGRQAELAALSLAVERASSGDGGSLTIIEGEAGIGKTRLCEEAELVAGQVGARVVWSHCQEDTGQPAYWPWTQILRTLTAEDPDGQVLDRQQSATRIVAAHIPELADLAGVTASRSVVEYEREQFQLRDSICTLVLAFAAEFPLLLIFDDLHWADPSSMATLSMLSERIRTNRVAAVGTTRPPDPGSSTSVALTGLKRIQGSAWVPLAGLNEAQARELFESTSTRSGTARGMIEAVRLSEGNPFFLTELAASWEQLDLDRSLTIPASAVDVVSSRLSAVPTEAINILHTAALLGREFDIPRLMAVFSSTENEAVAGAIEIGLQRRIIEERDYSQDRYRFIHEITRQVLVRRGSTIDRAKLHARIAEELENFFGERAVENASEIAFHWRESGSFGDAESRMRWAVTAGTRSLDAYEYNSAFDHFEYALNTTNEPADERLFASAQEGMGRSLAALERGGEAVEFLVKAFDYFARTGEIVRAADIAKMYLGSPSGMSGMVPLQERALQIDEISEADAARVKVSLARAFAIVLDDYDRATGMLQEVIDFARKNGDLALEMHAAGHGAQFAGFQRQFTDMRKYAETVLSIGSKIDDPFAVSAACAVLSQLKFFQGRGSEADELVERGIRSAARTRVSHRISTAAHYEQRIAVERCMWDKARAAALVSIETGFADPRVLALSAATEFQTGNFTEGESHLEKFIQTPVHERRTGESSAQFFRWIARSTLDPAHIGITRSEADDANRAPNPWSRSFGLITLGWIAVEENDPESARRLRSEILSLGLEDFDHAVLPPLTHVAGLPEEAAEEFCNLLPMFEERKMALTAAWMKYDFARFLLDHPESRPQLAAASIASTGKEFALSHGLFPLAGRFQELLEQNPAKDAATHGLSRREMEVLALLARGRSNREIAEELFISPATVNRHVSNMFTKLGVSNRAAATDLAHRLDLVN